MTRGEHKRSAPVRRIAAAVILLTTGGIVAAPSTTAADPGGTDSACCHPELLVSDANRDAGQDRVRGSDDAQGGSVGYTSEAQPAFEGNKDPGGMADGTGFENRTTTTKYPLRPQGSQLVRILDFPSCWNREFAVDAFPDQRHNPVTDHADFMNLMPTAVMAQAVNCINTGRTC